MSEPVQIATDTLPEERGILLPCPCCGEPEATIDLTLATRVLHCQECDTEFTTQDVANLIAKWQPVLAWLQQMPGAE